MDIAHFLDYLKHDEFGTVEAKISHICTLLNSNIISDTEFFPERFGLFSHRFQILERVQFEFKYFVCILDYFTPPSL